MCRGWLGGVPSTQRYCEALTPKPLYCFDFDTNPPLQGWVPPFAATGADYTLTSTVDTKTSRGGGALMQHLESKPGVAPSAPYLYAGFGFTPSEQHMLKHWRFAFDVWLDYDLGQAQRALIAAMSFSAPAPSAGYSLRFYVNSNGGFNDELGAGSPLPTHHLVSPIPGGSWHRIEITLDVVPTKSSTINLKIDDNVVFNKAAVAHTVAYETRVLSLVTLGMGAVALPTTGWTLRYDDVVFDGQ